jgi:predicted ferric reductase
MISYSIGVLALFFFLFPLLLTIRWRPLIKICGGLASFYRFHHFVGLFCFIPIFLHISSQFYELDFTDWYGFLDLTELGLSTAWFGFWLMIIALIGSYFKKIRYRNWQMIHLLFVPAYLLVFYHIWLFRPDHNFFLISIFILIGAGVIQIFLILITKLYPLHKTQFEISQLNKLNDDIFELNLTNLNSQQKSLYPPGQIVYVRFDSPEFSSSWHPFSIASCKADPQIKLLIKGFGHDTKQIETIQIGSKVSVVGPFQEFNISPETNQVWIAGGIGIAPFIGMIRCLNVIYSSKVQLFYYSNSEDEVQCKKELNVASETYSNFSWHSIISVRGSVTNYSLLSTHIDITSKTEYLICGPTGFMRNMRLYLSTLGIKRSYIQTEEFSEW